MERAFPIPVLRNKGKCEHLSVHMECNVGGRATADCFHPSFHNTCRFKKMAEKRTASKEEEIVDALEKA